MASGELGGGGSFHTADWHRSKDMGGTKTGILIGYVMKMRLQIMMFAVSSQLHAPSYGSLS